MDEFLLEKIKVGLLACIGILLGVNVYYTANQEVKVEALTQNEPAKTGRSKAVAQVPGNATNPTAGLANNAAYNPGQTAAQPANPATAAVNNPAEANPTQVTQSASRRKTAMQIQKYSHDFGTVMPESESKYIFNFTNTGDEPLIIENAVGSCGCTVPTFPREPIMPGKNGELEVIFRPKAGQVGVQNKTVTVTANTDPVTTTLNIKATVLKPE